MSRHQTHPDQTDDQTELHAHIGSTIVRQCDVAVVGGSAAGLAAALQLQRQARSVIVIDGGEPRNARAAHMHGYPGFDGAAPSDLVAAAKADVRRYGAECLDGVVSSVERAPDGGFVVVTDSLTIHARRVVAATGVSDALPTVDGIERHWGDRVIHCPFCHGYEVRDQRVVQVIDHPAALHPARFFAHLTGDLTLVVAENVRDAPGAADSIATLIRAGVSTIDGTPTRVIEAPAGELEGLELADGTRLDADAIVVTTTITPRVAPFASLDPVITAHPSGIADVLQVDERGETSARGLFAAGNLTDPSHQVLPAAANGGLVGAMVALSLVEEDLALEVRASASATEWEARYSGEQVWSGSPNGALVAEVTSLAPGRALDVGAGEGGDAVWLAEQGWTVTATDIATAGLDRLAPIASSRSLDIECVVADANALRPFGDTTFDLVALCYSAIPRTGDDRAIANLVDAVAPKGTLLVVGHAPPATGRGEAHHRASAWDGEAYVRTASFERALQHRADWVIECNEVRERPPGSASHGHHDEDVVFRARRRAT